MRRTTLTSGPGRLAGEKEKKGKAESASLLGWIRVAQLAGEERGRGQGPCPFKCPAEEKEKEKKIKGQSKKYHKYF